MNNNPTVNLTPDANFESRTISYNEIAEKLLQDRLYLTALELHTELLDCGREISHLKNFFSDPNNFERQVIESPRLISRTGSQATLDSLDLTRYSEDGERGIDEKVAILEFELRKARETIAALRNNLTVASELEESVSNPYKQKTQGDIKLYEQRALNFLINEYLLLHGYKLTSITFADENENQDFEDWDDVGLNVSKPADLLTLYREGLKQRSFNCKNSSCQTDLTTSEINDLLENTDDLNLKMKDLQTNLTLLQQQNIDLQAEVNMIHEKNNIEIMQTSFDKLIEESDNNFSVNNLNEHSKNRSSPTGTNDSEHFEIISGNTASNTTEENVVLMQDNVSMKSINEGDWANVVYETCDNAESRTKLNENIFDKISILRNLSQEYKQEIANIYPLNGDSLKCIFTQNITHETFVKIISECLVNIVPNIILNKREEVIPALTCSILLINDSLARDQLLKQLFNLKKKPTNEDRALILTAMVTIAKHLEENIVENELLPQLWEQLNHKHVERRLLVVDCCSTLIPYISNQIRNSLMISMLQQMFEDKEETVRESVVKALSLIIILAGDYNKYSIFEEVSLKCLNDPSIIVFNRSLQILFPVLSAWTIQGGYFENRFFKKLLNNFNEYLRENKTQGKNLDSDKILRYLTVFDFLLPFILAYVVHNDAVLDQVEENVVFKLPYEFTSICNKLSNPENWSNDKFNFGTVYREFINCDLKEEPWHELNWFLNTVIPDLINNFEFINYNEQQIIEQLIDLFTHMCKIFGKNFIKNRLYPIFSSYIQSIETILSNFNQYTPNLTILPIYIISILISCDYFKEAFSVLKRFLFALPICGIPLDCLDITIKGLCKLNFQEEIVTILWEGVMHSRPLVRAATANLFSVVMEFCSEEVISAKVMPAVVTLGSDSDCLVRTASLSTLSKLLKVSVNQEIHDKVCMQIQTYLMEPYLHENHSFARQLVISLGTIVNKCKTSFREDVVIPELSKLSHITSQSSNQTRKVDMTIALIQAYSNIVFSSLNNVPVSSKALMGLRYIELIVSEVPCLNCHVDNVKSMIQECEKKCSVSSENVVETKLSHNVNQSVEEVRQKMNRLFSPTVMKSTGSRTLQSMLKKK